MAIKAKGKPEPAKRDTKTLTVQAKPGDTESAAIARTLLRPGVQAAGTLKEYTKQMVNADLVGLIEELAVQAKAVNDGDLKRAEAMLTIQAHTLDSIFNNLAQKAINAEYMDKLDRYLRLALKAQSQCRATLETLAAVKNPQPVAFVQQANIAHGPQQVNNAAAAEASRAGKFENQPNKVLEHQHGERLDFGAAGAASGANPTLEAVGTVHRPQDAGG